MFEICSEKGKAERMVDLLNDGGEICMQQSIVRGLQEVAKFGLYFLPLNAHNYSYMIAVFLTGSRRHNYK